MSYIEIRIETDNDAFRLERELSCPECASHDVAWEPEFSECADCGHQWSGRLDIQAAQDTLREAVDRLPLYGWRARHDVRDVNGNTVGCIEINEEWS